MQKFMQSMFSKKLFQSRIKSANTQKSEGIFGYFVGPCLVYMVFYCVAGSYLTQFYTDVLGMAGIFLTMMPVISKIIDAITNVIMGRIIDKTRTAQGKARPWILMSGVFMAVTGILLYTVPKANSAVQTVWVIVSYNLFFAFAFTIYNMSHNLMVPLSTRNTKQRDGLAVLTSAGINMIPGLLVTIIMPLLIANIGVGADAQGAWIRIMSMVSILAIPAVLLEYYFTKERVTEESINEKGINTEDVVPFKMQVKAALSDKYWMLIMGFYLVFMILSYLSTNSMVYYCNWVLADSVAGGAAKQVLVNMIGQAPLGIGIFVLWPLINKFGKKRVTQVGFTIAAVGSLIVLLGGKNMSVVLVGLIIKSIGAIPTYAMMAMLAEALDHIDYVNGFRADGFSASVYSIIGTVTAGLAQSFMLGGINLLGYIAPFSAAETVTQPAGMQTFFSICFVGIPMAGYLIGALLMCGYNVEKDMPEISAGIVKRHREEAEARGEVYISPEEKARLEQEEADRIAEEKRVEELKERCAKKGLDFEQEEAKYQKKLAVKNAKKKR